MCNADTAKLNKVKFSIYIRPVITIVRTLLVAAMSIAARIKLRFSSESSRRDLVLRIMNLLKLVGWLIKVIHKDRSPSGLEYCS